MATAKWDGKRWRIRVSINAQVRSFSDTTPGRRGRQNVERRAAECGKLSDIVPFDVAWRRYLEEVKALTGPEHYVNTESIGRNYLLPTLADRKLCDLHPHDFQEVLWKSKKRNGEPLAKKSIQNIRAVIVAFSKFCKSAGLMDAALTDLKVPRSAPKVGKVILQPNEAKRLMNEFDEEWYVDLWRWLLCTGMRPGEALGLRWSDISDGVVTIRQSINYRGRITEGKNENARRAIWLNSVLERILDDQKRRTWRLRSEYIFCNHAGKSAKQTDAIHSWDRIRDALGTKASPYSLRHTYISYMAQSLPEQALKHLVGHSASMDTYGVYGHAVNGDGERASRASSIVLLDKFK